MNPPRAMRRAGPLQAIVLLLQCVLGVMGTAILAPVIPAIVAHFHDVPGIDYWGPLAVTIPSACVVLCSPVAGWLSDLVGRRRLLMWAVGAYALVGVLPYFLDDLAQIIAARVALGVVEAMVMTISTTLIGDFFEGAERDRWLGFQTAVASVSAVALLALGGMAGELGWRVPFLLYLVGLPLLLLLALFTWEPAPAGAGGGGATSWRAFPWTRVLGILVLTLPAGMMFYVVQIQMATALAERGITSPATAGFMTAAVSVGIPLGTLLFQRISRWPAGRLLCLAFATMAVGFGGMSLAAGVGACLAFAAINQFGCGLLLPTLVTWNMRQLPQAMRGRGTGLWQAVLSLGPPLGPAAVTALAAAPQHRILPVFLVVGGFAALLAAGAGLLSLRQRRTGSAIAG